ncbi:MAG: hypothetical protein DRH32_10325, partial [Deltaproteobacteria bacterium]
MQNGKIRVLCVEDNPMDRELIRHALEKESRSFVVKYAQDKKSFYSLLSSGGFDIVITDFNILGFEGVDVIRAIKEKRPGLPAIVVTGTGSEETAVQALQHGAADYVIKTPRHIAQLPHTIIRALEAKRTRDRLKEREANIIAIVENINDGIMVVNDRNRVEFANRAAGRLWGSDGGKLEGMEFSYRAKNGEILQIEIQQPDGKTRVAEMVESQTVWKGKNCRLVTLRDITDQKEAERQRRSLQEQLWQAQKLETVGRLAGGLAHEMNNMLNIIIGYCDLLLDDVGHDSPLCEGLNEIMIAGKQAANLTNQMLAFSRKQALQVEVIDLNDLLQKVGKMLGQLIGEDIELALVFSEGPSCVLVDPMQMELVLMNLAVNARDAMPDGGKLTIEVSNVELDGNYVTNHVDITAGKYVLLAVTDSGVGMDQATMSQVFEPFFTTKERGKGTGLGLSTVYGIVKQFGGSIFVYSEPGHGTTFKIYLPRTLREPKTKKRAPEKPGATVKDYRKAAVRGNILIAEDEDALRALMEKIFTDIGFNVASAANGTDALLIVENQEFVPDLLITDIIMPGMKGVELAACLREKLPGIKLLYISGYTDNSIVHNNILDS